ncbi:hypothetical protein F5887DRAFT_975191 [Amanita rubescens]|nr:hypothetical protein F5887DRAFT_975191 [Amanita rubescens]
MNSRRRPRRSSSCSSHHYRLQPTFNPLNLSHSRSAASLRTRLPSPSDDQEYCDVLYKLDLGVESPYLGSAYADEAFTKRILEEPPMLGDVAASTSAVESSSVVREDYNWDCRMCLRKAVSPCRTRCCGTVFCWEHITEWLSKEESGNLCPSCDKACILFPPPIETSRSSPPRSRTSSTSSSSTRTTISSTLSCPNSAGTIDEDEEEEEDMWDVKTAWKKSDGVSLDVVEMIRDVMGESIKFVGLNGPRSVDEVSVKTRVASVVGLVLVLVVLFR